MQDTLRSFDKSFITTDLLYGARVGIQYLGTNKNINTFETFISVKIESIMYTGSKITITNELGLVIVDILTKNVQIVTSLPYGVFRPTDVASGMMPFNLYQLEEDIYYKLNNNFYEDECILPKGFYLQSKHPFDVIPDYKTKYMDMYLFEMKLGPKKAN